jgi:Zn-dependent peptidase ImmA (M78 family)
LSPNKALIQLSWRYKSDDQFWFTFFHEASHILLHGKHHVFVDPDIGGQQADQSATEQEADNYASNILISTADWQRFIKTMDFRDEETIVKFAEELGIAPGIVVGKLQHLERLAPNLYNNLKKSLKEFSNLEIPPA